MRGAELESTVGAELASTVGAEVARASVDKTADELAKAVEVVDMDNSPDVGPEPSS